MVKPACQPKFQNSTATCLGPEEVYGRDGCTAYGIAVQGLSGGCPPHPLLDQRGGVRTTPLHLPEGVEGGGKTLGKTISVFFVCVVFVFVCVFCR